MLETTRRLIVQMIAARALLWRNGQEPAGGPRGVLERGVASARPAEALSSLDKRLHRPLERSRRYRRKFGGRSIWVGKY